MRFPSWLIHPCLQTPLQSMGWFAPCLVPHPQQDSEQLQSCCDGRKMKLVPALALHPADLNIYFWMKRRPAFFFVLEGQTVFENVEIWLSCLPETSTPSLAAIDFMWWVPGWPLRKAQQLTPQLMAHANAAHLRIQSRKSEGSSLILLSVIHHIHFRSSMWQYSIFYHMQSSVAGY